jgi:NitT/TauT family transport system substrate-binding protein
VLGIILLLQALTVVVSGPITSTEYLPLHVAESEGYFTREGLHVTIRTTRAEPGAAEALAQGQAQIVATSLESILRFGIRTTSPAPRLVFGLTAAPPVALLVSSAAQDGPRSVEDLPGTRVGVVTPGTPEHTWFGWLLARAGLNVAQMSITSLGSRGLVGALESGEVHAGLVTEPAASRLLKDGRVRVLVDLRSPDRVAQALGALTVNAAVFTRADGRVSDRDLDGFLRALLAAERRIAESDAADLSARLSPRLARSRGDFEERLETARAVYLTNGLVSAEQLQETIAMIRGHLALSPTLRVPKTGEFLYLAPLRRVLKASPHR